MQTEDGSLTAYIREHNLAVLIDTIVQQLVIARPDDPFAFLADRLRLERALRKKGRSLAPTLNSVSLK
jgi:hypothetical protein